MDAYNVGIRLSLLNAVSPGLLRLISQFRTAEGAALALQRRLDGVKRSFLVGGLQIGVGVGVLAALKPALDQAKQFQVEATKFSLYGMGDAANNEAQKFAKSMNIMGSSYVQNMRLIWEAQGVFRESGKLTLAQQFEGAKIAAPILAKLSFIEAGLSDDQRASRHAQDLAMLRFVEIRGGANDPAQFRAIADWGFKLQQSSGGVVDWSGLQQMVARAGPMARTLSQDAISKLEPAIADLKGGLVGSGLRTSFQRLLGTQRMIPRQAVAEFLSLGLWDRSKVELTREGGIKRFLGRPGEVFKYNTQFTTDPVAFFTDTFLPALVRKYGPEILGNTPKAIAERSTEETMVFGPGTAAQVFAQIDKLLPTIQRSLEAQNKTMGIDAAAAAAGKTLSGQQVALAAKYNDLLEQTGERLLPLAVRVMQALTPLIGAMSKFATMHPRQFTAIVDGVVTLAGLSIGMGLLNVFGGIKSLVGLAAPLFASGTLLKLGIAAEKIPVVGDALASASLNAAASMETLTGAAGLGGLTMALGGFVAASAAAVIGLQMAAHHLIAQQASAGDPGATVALAVANGAGNQGVRGIPGPGFGLGALTGLGWLGAMKALELIYGKAPSQVAAPPGGSQPDRGAERGTITAPGMAIAKPPGGRVARAVAAPVATPKAPALAAPGMPQDVQDAATIAALAALPAKAVKGVALAIASETKAVADSTAAFKGFRTGISDLTAANKRLTDAVTGLTSRIAQAPTKEAAAPAINIHVHGAKDPHAMAREVAHHVKKVLASLGGPQRGTSAFDPTVSLPQVGTPYSV